MADELFRPASMFRAAAFPAAVEATPMIEISERLVRPQVIRDGALVRAVEIDPVRAESLVNTLKPILRPAQPRVVTQGVPAGAFVQKGTTIDLTLVRPANIRIDVLGDVHPALATRNVAAVLTAIPPAVSTILADKPEAVALTPAERITITAFLDAEQVPTAGATTGPSSFESVYSKLQDIQVFK